MLVQNHVGSVSLSPAVRNSNTNGTAVDLAGYMATSVVFQCGAITDGTHTPDIEESDDNSTFTDVADADMSAVPAEFTANTLQLIEYKGTKRYIRAQVNSDGSTGASYSAGIIRGRAMQNDAAH